LRVGSATPRCCQVRSRCGSDCVRYMHSRNAVLYGTGAVPFG
jgi:hypothetical protein